MTSQTEARLQLPKTNKFVRTNNLLSDTWLLQREFYQRYLMAIRTYFTRWLIRTNSYDLTHTILYDFSKPQWRVGLGAGLGVGHSYKFIRIGNS